MNMDNPEAYSNEQLARLDDEHSDACNILTQKLASLTDQQTAETKQRDMLNTLLAQRVQVIRQFEAALQELKEKHVPPAALYEKAKNMSYDPPNRLNPI